MNLIVTGLAFVTAALITGYLCHPGTRFYRLDHPNARSLHVNPTPRGGGLGILAGILVSGALLVAFGEGSDTLGWLAAAMLLVALISLFDDWLSIHFGLRIIVHFTAAGLLVWDGFWLQSITLPDDTWVLSDFLAIGLSLLFVVWMINLYNFMDGMDGLAGGMAVIGFGTFAALGWLSGHEVFTTLNLVVAAAAGGFLIFNFPPARIFMGDIGSSALGFLAAAFGLWADKEQIFPLWVAVLVFSPFIADATATLVKRILRSEKFWEAHKTHYYQRLVQVGWGHRRTALWEYALMVLCAVSAIMTRSLAPAAQWVLIAIWVPAYLLIMVLVHWLEVRRKRMAFK